jgi:aspartyl-tRNA synthetase
VLLATGTVRARPDEMVNKNLATGGVEVVVDSLTVENTCKPLPYNLDDPNTSEDLRLKYRYLEMRQSKLGDYMRLRHRVTKVVRDYLYE